MKRVGQLFPIVTSFENLLLAFRKARKGTRTRPEVTEYSFHLEGRLLDLQERLLGGIYQPQAYHYFKINDPKERLISVAPFEDRIVHHALINVLEPIYEKIFIFDSYATRKGKGMHAAINRAQGFLRGSSWYLKADIDHYFDSMRHDVLLALIERKIKDAAVLALIERIVANGGGGGTGLPIGNLTSQFFANVYLNPLDHFVKEQLRARHYLRYMDDFVLFEPEKERLKRIRPAIADFLFEKLSLQLKVKATFINSAQNGLTFLGRRIFPNVVRFARPNLRNVLRRLRQGRQRFLRGQLLEEQYLQSMNSYWSLLGHHQSYQLRRVLIEG